jgi:hypothetical protein
MFPPVRLGKPRTPAATLWRAFFLTLALVAPLAGWAQHKRYRPQPDYVQIGVPDQEEGRRLLAAFRSMGLVGDYYFEFQLRVMPRRGDERVYQGQLWSTRGPQGTLTRVVLHDPAGGERRLLVQSGEHPALWSWQTGDAAPRKLGLAELFEPLVQTDVTPFDLQMPFLYWGEFAYEGTFKMRGRPSDRFLFYPPAELGIAYPALTGVRVSLDSQFHALVEVEQLGEGDRSLKTVSLLELKKAQDQWLVKTIDVRDAATRNKTRFSVTAAALGQEFSRALFEPAVLADEVRPPAEARIVRLAP